MNEPLNPDVAILNAALELPADRRAAYLEAACAGDAALRQQVEALLQSHEQAGDFLEAPPSALDFKRTALVNLPPTEKPGDKIGRYKLLQRIGEGGCGVVYMAEQEEPVRRRVALKVIKLGMDTKQVIARFEAERQALAMMDHPNIAKIFDAGVTESPVADAEGRARHYSVRAGLQPSGSGAQGTDAPYLSPGRPYFVMELVRGVKITDFCNQKNLTTRERLDLFIQVCRAVQHAHQKGIIHRDLKPSNILVTSDDGVPVPKVIDFGIAKATQGRLTDHTVFTAFEQFIGTPAYMSPEQAEMSLHDVDTRTDIYSLGVLLYELLTDQTPFDAKELLAAGLDAMRRTIREVEPVKPSTRLTQELVAADQVGRVAPRAPLGVPSSGGPDRVNAGLQTTDGAHGVTRPTTQPSTLNPQPADGASLRRLLQEVRGDLDWIVMKCLEKDRARRYETANGLAADLTRHLNDEPVVARPASRLYKFQKTVRRHKLAFAAAAAILLVLAGGITLSTWQAVRATRARAEAEKARQNEAGLRQTAQTEANRAEAAAMDSKKNLSASDFLQAVRFIAEDNANDALAYLARSLSVNPSNGAALTRLATLLTYRTWKLPILVLKHEKPVNSAEYSPDGKRIVTASADGTARVWDARTGQPLTEPMKHSFNVTSAQFSPDEKRIVTVSDDMTTRVWDAQTGQPVTGPMKHGSLVTSVHFSPDGKRIVTGSWDNTARIWDAETGQALTKPLVQDLTLKEKEPEKKEQAKSKGTINSVNVVGGKTSVDGKTSFGLEIGKAVRAQFSLDGERIVTASEDGTARVWDAQTGHPLTEPMRHARGVASAQFSPDGKRIVTVLEDNTACVWDAQTGQRLADPANQGSPARSKQFSPDGERILTAAGDNAAYVAAAGNAAYMWEARTAPPLPLRQPLQLFQDGSIGRISQPQMGFSHDGRRLVMPLRDKTACVWDAQTGELLTRMIHDTNVASAQFSPDDKRIVTTTWLTSTVRVWDAQTGQPLTGPMKHSDDVSSAQFSPEGKRIVTASWDSTARVWDAQTGQPLTEPMKHGSGVSAAHFSPDGERIVTASSDSTARVWDAQTGQPLTEPMKHGKAVTWAQFSLDGKRIVTGSWDSTARVWDAQTGQPMTGPMKHGDAVTSAQFSPDGSRIVTGSWDSTARVWDAQTGQPLTEPIKPGGFVSSAEFSPDGKRIVTAQNLQNNKPWEHTVRVWDAQTGQPLTEPIIHGSTVFSPGFSPDGKRIVTATMGGGARVWDVAPSQSPCPDWLLQVAEAISGKVLNQEGVLEPTRLNRVETLNQIRQKLAAQPDDDWVVWGRWLLADRATRTISPFAKITVPEYIERLIKENTRQSLDEAEQLAAGKPEILQRISEARETLEQPKK